MFRIFHYFMIVTSLSTFVKDVLGQGNGAVQLYKNGHVSHRFNSGIVQIYDRSIWGNICFDGEWGNNEADVVCRQLGWSGASSTQPEFEATRFGFDVLPTTFGNVNCANNSFPVLMQCSMSKMYDSFCGDSYDVTVSCYSTKLWVSLGYIGMLRLIDGPFVTDGRVEIYCNNEWGTICDDGISNIEVDTICRHLGYSEATRYDHLILPGNASSKIWLDDVHCGREVHNCITQCRQCPKSEYDNCVHGEDITVSCSYNLDSGGSNLDTCRTISADASTSSISQAALIGVILAGALFLLIIAIIVFVCCILMCSSAKQQGEDDSVEMNSDEKDPTERKTTITPEVVQMECSPKMYRKAHPHDRHLTGQHYSHRHPVAYNPYYTHDNMDNVDDSHQYITTPPAYMGNPAVRYY